MGLSKQAKTLNKQQIEMISSYLRQHRNGLRNQTIFLLSVRSGLRAKEIAELKWRELLTPDGNIAMIVVLVVIAMIAMIAMLRGRRGAHRSYRCPQSG